MKITNAETRLADKALRSIGFTHVGMTGSGHHSYRHADEGWQYTLPATPSDRRWLGNFWRDLSKLTGRTKADLISEITGEPIPGSSTRAKRAKPRQRQRPNIALAEAPPVIEPTPEPETLIEILEIEELPLDEQINAVADARRDAHRHHQREAACECAELLDELYAKKRRAA